MTQMYETPDGVGKLKQRETRHGRTQVQIEGSGFSGWYAEADIQRISELEDHTQELLSRLPADGTQLPWDPRPRFQDYDNTSTIQPIWELPGNLEDTNSLNGLSHSFDHEEIFPPVLRHSNTRVRHSSTLADFDDPNDTDDNLDEIASEEELDAPFERADDYFDRGQIGTGSPYVKSKSANKRLDQYVFDMYNIDVDQRGGSVKETEFVEALAEMISEGEVQTPSDVDDIAAQFSIPGRKAKTSAMPTRWKQYLAFLEKDAPARKAAWIDVRKKAVRLRQSNQVEVRDFTEHEIFAKVQGDTGIYDTEVHRKNAFGSGVTHWTCSCEWGKWAYQRERTYVGRMCSHAYALFMEMQSLSTNKKRKPVFTNKETQEDIDLLSALGITADEDLKLQGPTEDPDKWKDQPQFDGDELTAEDWLKLPLIGGVEASNGAGFSCPKCGSGDVEDGTGSGFDYQCVDCGNQFLEDDVWDDDDDFDKESFLVVADGENEEDATKETPDEEDMDPMVAAASTGNLDYLAAENDPRDVVGSAEFDEIDFSGVAKEATADYVDDLQGEEVEHERPDDIGDDADADEPPEQDQLRTLTARDPNRGGIKRASEQVAEEDVATVPGQEGADPRMSQLAYLMGGDEGPSGDGMAVDVDPALAARFSKTSAKAYSPGEQQQLIDEMGTASQHGSLNLANSFYEMEDAIL